MSIEQPPILITGAARSGTSMIAGIINICGAWGGKMAGKTRYNKKGMFENSEIRETLVKPALERMGCDRLGQNPLPDIGNVKNANKYFTTYWRRTVDKIVNNQGYISGPWMYKGAKMCLIWPIWDVAYPLAKWVIVRRNDQDIVNSCMKTGFMKRYKTPEGWGIWVDEHKERFNEMRNAGLDIIEVWPTKAIQGDLAEAQAMIEKLGLQWMEQEVSEFICPALWHESIVEE